MTPLITIQVLGVIYKIKDRRKEKTASAEPVLQVAWDDLAVDDIIEL